LAKRPERALSGVEPCPQSLRYTVSGSNTADGGDIVALIKNLRTCFGDKVENHQVHNGSDANTGRPYLTAKEAGDAVASGFR
jgi:hypothetical protein